jgi:hypothetical protein
MVNMATAINTIIPSIFKPMPCRDKLLTIYSYNGLSAGLVCGQRCTQEFFFLGGGFNKFS